MRSPLRRDANAGRRRIRWSGRPPGRSAPDCTASEIESLNALDPGLLHRRWRALMGRAAPAHLSRSLMVRILAYRQQAQAHGDLDRATLRVLDAAIGQGEPAPVVSRRGQPRSSAGFKTGHGPHARIWRCSASRDGGGARLCLERPDLCEPFKGRPCDHRHPLERTPLLRLAADGEGQRWEAARKSGNKNMHACRRTDGASRARRRPA